ncbi:prolipoprotein diacylglyceryl transferase [Candidatus Gottesmanbacteria bacterium]|nr:prolipoprotein diacylglyceryl transferase [Candidatus Gottesmanbacteria bacterium]
MYPTLFTLGGVHIASFSIFLILGWCVFSFVFWKSLRDDGVLEERIFDLTFYATTAGLVVARAWYVLIHWGNFSGSLIKIPALWVAPGMSLMAGVIAGLLVMLSIAKRMKIRLGTVVDAVGLALPGALIVGSIGSLLDGGSLGRVAGVPWAIRYVGLPELRHPYPIYMAATLVIILLVMGFVSERAKSWKWPLGLPGLLFFFLWSIGIFVLEYVRESDVYWYTVSAQGWEALVLFFGVVGVWYAYCGGKFIVRERVHKVKETCMHGSRYIYAKFPKRHA